MASMAMGSTIETSSLASRQDDVSRNLRRVALAVPAVVLLGGAAVMVLEPWFGLFAAAFVLGWTQLVGL